MIRINVPCSTSNLGPGFDTLGLALNRFLSLTVTPGNEPAPAAAQRVNERVTITVEGNGKEHIAADETNLVYAAARVTAEKLGATLPAFHLRLNNQIPAYGGLGGSGAAIAGGVVLADALLNGKLSRAEMLSIAVGIEGHPDNVSAALYGGLTINCFDAERNIHCRSVTIEKPLSVVTCSPHFHVQTKAARKILPREIPLADAVANIENAAALVAALMTGDVEALRYATADRLHERYRAALIPGYDDVKRAALDAGALSFNISGAGPTVFAFAAADERRIAAAMEEAFRAHGQAATAAVMQIERNGAHLLDQNAV